MADADPGPAETRQVLPIESFGTVKLPARSGNPSLVGLDGRDLRSRAFDLLRTRLATSVQERGVKLVGLTSPAPAAGKSFLSLNLAASLARLGEWPVYLVDLDLRRASVAEQFGLEVEAGVDAFLAGDVTSLQEIGLRIEGMPLVVFPTNPVSESSAEYLAGRRYQELTDQLRWQAPDGIVLFDLPPVFASDDAMLSIAELDGYIMVVDSGRTSKRQLRDAMEMLRPATCLGSILNRYKGGILDTYGYSSGYYQRYYGA